jgi:hypothetical protein
MQISRFKIRNCFAANFAFCILNFAFVFAALTLACNTAASVTEPWHIEIASEGGFTGRGVGKVLADSDHASERLRQAVADAKPEQWAHEYTDPKAPHGHPDEIRYTLTLKTGDHEHVTSWYETATLPHDLRAIVDAARSAK